MRPLFLSHTPNKQLNESNFKDKAFIKDNMIANDIFTKTV
ncbi:hypothetical protein AK89_05595 [Enterococcus mundtii CRL35]|nr:hypothetical protein AK89_05595 [Enterococcus mundtii CRL35]